MDKKKLYRYLDKVEEIKCVECVFTYYVTNISRGNLICLYFYKQVTSNLGLNQYKLEFIHFYNKKSGEYVTRTYSKKYKGKWLTGTLDRYFSGKIYEKDTKGLVSEIEKNEWEMLSKKLKAKYQMKINEYKAFNRQVRKLPKAFVEWAHHKIVPGYALYSNSEKNFICSICGTANKITKLLRGDRIKCNSCGRILQAQPKGHYQYSDYSRCAMAQKCKTGMVVRYFHINSNGSSKYGNNINLHEYRRDFINREGKYKGYCYSNYKLSNYIGFIDENECSQYLSMYRQSNYFPQDAYFWKDSAKLFKDTDFQYAFLSDEFLTEKSLKIIQQNISRYFSFVMKYPALETMFKNGYHKIINSIFENSSLMLTGEVQPHKALGISRYLVRAIAPICNVRLLRSIKLLYEKKVNIDDEVIRFLNLHYLSDDSFEIMIRYGFRKIMRYLDNNGITKNINEYFDYIEACHNLNFRMTKEILYPENLRVAHDEVMKKVQMKNNAEKEMAYQELRKSDLAIYKPLEVDNLLIRLPESISEIIDEGISQHNCVGKMYVDRIISRKSDILFVRKKEEPNKSFVTLEVFDGRIVQCRYKYNKVCGSKITDAVNKYLESIKNIA